MPPQEQMAYNYTATGTTVPNPLGDTQQPMAPSRQQAIRPINIRQLNHGYMVEVGCQTVAIETATKLIALLSSYILQPESTEELYVNGKLL
jgi:hypothetical protein